MQTGTRGGFSEHKAVVHVNRRFTFPDAISSEHQSTRIFARMAVQVRDQNWQDSSLHPAEIDVNQPSLNIAGQPDM